MKNPIIFSQALITHIGAHDQPARDFSIEAHSAALRVFGSKFASSVNEVIEQDIPIRSYFESVRNLLAHEWENFVFEFSSVSFSQHSFRKKLKTAAGCFSLFIFNCIPTKRRFRIAEIEVVLTKKHVQAWWLALQNDADLLLVFESDARLVGSPSTLDALYSFMTMASRPSTIGFLSTPFSENQVGVVSTKLPDESALKVVTPPRSNTACCYLLNKSAIKEICSWSKTTTTHLRADWLINKFLHENKTAAIWVSRETVANVSLLRDGVSSVRL